MVHLLKYIKEYFINNINNIIFSISMDNKRYQKIDNRIYEIKCIQVIKDSLKNKDNFEKYLFKNISSFLFGDFIEVRFKDSEYCYYLFRNDVISSETLYKFYSEYEETEKHIYKMNIRYNNMFFNLLMNYLIYNDNKDNIGTLVYNSKSWLYLKDNDDFNNDIIFSLNYYELLQFKQYIKYFKIKVLDFKVNAILDIINLTMRATINQEKSTPLRKFI